MELQNFLKEEAQWFNIWKDLRDDISHRTSYDKVRRVIFPDLLTFHGAVSGNKPFLDEKILKQVISEYLDKLLFFSCLVEDFFRKRFPNLGKTYFVGDQAEVFVFHEVFSQPGTCAVIVGQDNIDLLKWWFGERVLPFDSPTSDSTLNL